MGLSKIRQHPAKLYHHNDKSLPAMAAPQAIPVACFMLHVPNDHSHGFHDSNPFNTACICMYKGQFLRQAKYKPSDLWLRYIIEKEPFCGIKTFQSCVTFSCMFVQVAHTIIDLSGWSSCWVVHLQEATNPLGIVALPNFVQLPFEKGKV